MTLVWIVLGSVVGLLLLIGFLVAPGRMSKEAKRASRAFVGCNCAHRGLHSADQSVPENSLAAFAAAREAGYGVELDVQLTKDGQVVVFHDDDLPRMCGVEGRVDARDWEALRGLRLCESEETIPLFSQSLEVLGDVPVVVEIKSAGEKNHVLCEKTLEILRKQGRRWCVESFDPRVVRWLRKNAPDVLRGQLSNPAKYFDTLSKPTALAIGHLLTNVLARPHFVAYNTSPLPLTVRLCRALGAMMVVWTVHADAEPERRQRENDVVIFEYYTPAPRYRVGENADVS